jgi:hypothetical protein
MLLRGLTYVRNTVRLETVPGTASRTGAFTDIYILAPVEVSVFY